MKLFLSTFIAGVLFGSGLTVSGMTDPARVIGFLDITGQWDITLLFVMGGALLITVPFFPLVQKQNRPWFNEKFYLPSKQDLDWKLISGSVVFGIGWGIGGFCPGPAIASLVTGSLQVVYFVITMLVGQLLAILFEKKTQG